MLWRLITGPSPTSVGVTGLTSAFILFKNVLVDLPLFSWPHGGLFPFHSCVIVLHIYTVAPAIKSQFNTWKQPFYEGAVHIETAYLCSFIWNACFKWGDKVFDHVQDQILQPLQPLMQLVTTKGGGLPSAELLETGSFVFQKARQFTFANVNICKRSCWAQADWGPPEGLEEALFTCSEECRPAQMLLYLSGTQGHSAGRDGPLCPSPKFPPHSINNKTQCGWPERRNWNSSLMLLRKLTFSVLFYLW